MVSSTLATPEQLTTAVNALKNRSSNAEELLKKYFSAIGSVSIPASHFAIVFKESPSLRRPLVELLSAIEKRGTISSFHVASICSHQILFTSDKILIAGALLPMVHDPERFESVVLKSTAMEGVTSFARKRILQGAGLTSDEGVEPVNIKPYHEERTSLEQIIKPYSGKLERIIERRSKDDFLKPIIEPYARDASLEHIIEQYKEPLTKVIDATEKIISPYPREQKYQFESTIPKGSKYMPERFAIGYDSRYSIEAQGLNYMPLQRVYLTRSEIPEHFDPRVLEEKYDPVHDLAHGLVQHVDSDRETKDRQRYESRQQELVKRQLMRAEKIEQRAERARRRAKEWYSAERESLEEEVVDVRHVSNTVRDQQRYNVKELKEAQKMYDKRLKEMRIQMEKKAKDERIARAKALKDEAIASSKMVKAKRLLLERKALQTKKIQEKQEFHAKKMEEKKRQLELASNARVKRIAQKNERRKSVEAKRLSVEKKASQAKKIQEEQEFNAKKMEENQRQLELVSGARVRKIAQKKEERKSAEAVEQSHTWHPKFIGSAPFVVSNQGKSIKQGGKGRSVRMEFLKIPGIYEWDLRINHEGHVGIGVVNQKMGTTIKPGYWVGCDANSWGTWGNVIAYHKSKAGVAPTGTRHKKGDIVSLRVELKANDQSTLTWAVNGTWFVHNDPTRPVFKNLPSVLAPAVSLWKKDDMVSLERATYNGVTPPNESSSSERAPSTPTTKPNSTSKHSHGSQWQPVFKGSDKMLLSNEGKTVEQQGTSQSTRTDFLVTPGVYELDIRIRHEGHVGIGVVNRTRGQVLRKGYWVGCDLHSWGAWNNVVAYHNSKPVTVWGGRKHKKGDLVSMRVDLRTNDQSTLSWAVNGSWFVDNDRLRPVFTGLPSELAPAVSLWNSKDMVAIERATFVPSKEKKISSPTTTKIPKPRKTFSPQFISNASCRAFSAGKEVRQMDTARSVRMDFVTEPGVYEWHFQIMQEGHVGIGVVQQERTDMQKGYWVGCDAHSWGTWDNVVA